MLTIKKFLQLPEVQEALENENLDKVYGLYEDNCGTCASKVQLTQFFMDVGINVTEYMTVIGRYTFDTLPIKEVDVSENVQAIDNYAFIIPAGKWHNLTNIGDIPLKLYSIYAPPNHSTSYLLSTRQRITVNSITMAHRSQARAQA